MVKAQTGMLGAGALECLWTKLRSIVGMTLFLLFWALHIIRELKNLSPISFEKYYSNQGQISQTL